MTDTPGAQVVTNHGTEVAVVLGIEDCRRLGGHRPDFKEYLLAGPTAELTITRSTDGPRAIDLFDA